MNRNFNNTSMISADYSDLISQNNSKFLSTINTYISKQVFNEIDVTTLNIKNPVNNSINLGGITAGSNIICIGNSITTADNNVIIGHSSGNNNSISLNNVYLGSNISHLSSNPYSNSCGVGNSCIIVIER